MTTPRVAVRSLLHSPAPKLQCSPRTTRSMASVVDAKPYMSHEERTAHAPRGPGMNSVFLSAIKEVNPRIRLLQLSPQDQERGIDFLPGQWLDVFCPGIPKAGGFTITSIPALAKKDQKGVRAYLELAIQYSPKNPPAAWLWRPHHEIVNSTLDVRVGGSFTWPPQDLDIGDVQNIILIAGGVGINPLISILTQIKSTHPRLKSVKLLYGTKTATAEGRDILFLPRIAAAVSSPEAVIGSISAEIFTTLAQGAGVDKNKIPDVKGLTQFKRRMEREDVMRALGEEVEERAKSLTYICGPQAMTDEFVDMVKGFDGVRPERVLCEKWW